jgi:adenine-specific DNA-methyltransferase
MSKNYDKLIGLLKELFQFDRADLDFGIFRIMNQKRDEISAFLEKDLLPQVKEAFSEYKSADIAGFEDELKKTIKYAKEAGYDSEQSPKVKGLREKISLYGVDVNALENEVFSHLYNFFRRYYHEGDFLSLRRYKEGVYAIPYEGEEVKLYWANHDQYYIKSSEYLRDYAFKLPSGKPVHFKLMDADIEKDNVKAQNGKERRFILFEEKPVEEIDGELVIRFEYRPDVEKRTQANLNKQAVETILNQKGVEQWVKELSELMPTEKNNDRTLLEKHLTDYTARNTFDYFIHKDLGGFLRRELDFYIKNEVMHLDDIENETAPRVEQYLSKIKVIRKIAGKIIAFLEQLENFQKKLWLKKKFVVETNYCVTLDRVPEALYEEIAANDTQREEWIKLFAIDEIEGEIGAEGYSKPLSMRFLKENKFLVVDTKFFEEDFKRKLLGSFEDLDAECDGLLVHSENFQALNLLQERYREKVKCIYIDPPYNTNASEIIYKNGYKNSSWLSFIENRLVLGKILLSKSGIQCTTIDDIEFHKLREIISGIFNEENIAGVVSIKNNPSGRSTVKGISIAHEYAIFSFSSGDSTLGMVPRTQEQLAQYREKDKKGKFQWRNFMRSGGANDFKTARPKLHYPLVVYKGLVRLPKMQWNTKTNIWEMIEKLDATETAVWPVSNGNEYTWRLGVDSLKPRIGEVRVRNSRNGKQIIEIKFRLDEEGVLPKTIWDDKYVNATAYGTTALRHITGIPQSFSFPKSIYAIERCIRVCGTTFDSIVIDYFAGSGTTAHALINLNREDNGNRKYILVEMGDYFDTVLKPRIQKVIYSKDWKNGKPISREGSSHMFKYICLESYEDTLNNLELKRTDKQEQLLLSDAMSKKAKEEYMLSYMLDVESKGSLLNINTFNDPFNYKLNIATNSVGETKPTKIDMVETFNYLIGLTVKHIDHIQGFCVVEGTNPKEEKVLIIWRNIKEKSNKALETFFRKQDYSTRDMEFDLIYVNGDNNLENIRRPDETWKVRLIEEEFKRLMFDVEDV